MAGLLKAAVAHQL